MLRHAWRLVEWLDKARSRTGWEESRVILKDCTLPKTETDDNDQHLRGQSNKKINSKANTRNHEET